MSSDEFLDVQLEADVEIFDFNASNYLWNIMSSEKYRAYNWQGVCDPRIECGDTVRIYIDETNYFDSFVFTNKIEYNGALTQTLTATTDSTIKTEAVRTGSVASTVVNNISTNESTTQQVTQSIVKQITSGSEEDSESLTTLSKGVVSNISADKESIATLQNAIGGFKVESVTELPATTDNNTIYLIQGEVNVT
jgi:hypothetical protein